MTSAGPRSKGAANPARELARRIDRTIPLVYGGGALGAVAAHAVEVRRQREREGARRSGTAYPELDHNEICGWGQHGDVTRQVLTLVELRHGFEHARLAPRFDDHARDRSKRRSRRCSTVRGRGRGPARAAARPHVPRRLGRAATSRSTTTSTPARSTRSRALQGRRSDRVAG